MKISTALKKCVSSMRSSWSARMKPCLLSRLNLLSLEQKSAEIGLIFSGAGEIRLEVKEIRCQLEDLGEPWPTLWRPSHLD